MKSSWKGILMCNILPFIYFIQLTISYKNIMCCHRYYLLDLRIICEDEMIMTTYFLSLFITLHAISIVTAFVPAVSLRVITCLYYNIPRKKRNVGGVIKSYSPFKSNRNNASPLDFVQSEIVSRDVSSSNNCRIYF